MGLYAALLCSASAFRRGAAEESGQPLGLLLVRAGPAYSRPNFHMFRDEAAAQRRLLGE